MISKEILRSIVKQQKGQQGESGLIDRDLLPELLGVFGERRIIVLTGMRRTGKSTLMKQIMGRKKNSAYFNFEDEKLLDFDAKDFEMLNEALIEEYGNAQIYFFDEIQNVSKFELFVRRLQDQGKKVVLTGSNASLLSQEFGTRLTGRYKPFEIYPFSFREFLRLRSIETGKETPYQTGGRVEALKAFRQYIIQGGLPEFLKNNDPQYAKTLYDNILYRDIISRHMIRRQRLLRELVGLLTNQIGSRFTYNSLKKALGFSNAISVKEYVGFMSNSYLFFELNKFDYSVRRQLDAPKKIYINDPAFYQIAGLSKLDNLGRLLENAVFIELRRRGSEAFYFSKEGECDFVLKEGAKIAHAIQVCYELNAKNRPREIGGLKEAMDEFGLKEGVILTFEQQEDIQSSGKKIHVLPAWRWMLGL
ncbi:MAG: ATP-binding protein [Candidatus Micrarchaeota archaeon]